MNFIKCIPYWIRGGIIGIIIGILGVTILFIKDGVPALITLLIFSFPWAWLPGINNANSSYSWILIFPIFNLFLLGIAGGYFYKKIKFRHLN